MYQYPYGNSQQLNLDWLLTQWRQFQKQVEDMIAPQWSDTVSYTQNDIVIHEHTLFYCNTGAATIGEFKPDEWTVFSIADALQGNI